MNTKITPEAVLTHQERRAMLIKSMASTETVGHEKIDTANFAMIVLILGMLVGLAINAG